MGKGASTSGTVRFIELLSDRGERRFDRLSDREKGASTGSATGEGKREKGIMEM